MAPGLALERNRRPHPQVELAPELFDQALLVLGEPGIALGKQHVPVARSHPQQLHRTNMAAAPSLVLASLVIPSTSTGPGPAPMSAQAVGDRLGGNLARATRAASSGLSPQGQLGGERRRVGASGAVRGAIRMPRPGNRLDPLAVEEDVGAIVGVASGDDHCARPEGVHRPGELLGGLRVLPEPAQLPSLGAGSG